jgi:hypothetical protein
MDWFIQFFEELAGLSRQSGISLGDEDQVMD